MAEKKKLVFSVEHERGDTVYVLSDEDQLPRQIVGYTVMGREILYLLRYMGEIAEFHDTELSTSKNPLLI